MPRTSTRDLLAVLRALEVDVGGVGAEVSDDITLVYDITPQALAPVPPAPPVVIPHMSVGYGVGVVPVGTIAAYRLTAPSDREVHVLAILNSTTVLNRVTITAEDRGTFTPNLNIRVDWGGVPLLVLERGNIGGLPGLGSLQVLNNQSGFGAPNRLVSLGGPFIVPASNFLYITGTAVNTAVNGTLVCREPIP